MNSKKSALVASAVAALFAHAAFADDSAPKKADKQGTEKISCTGVNGCKGKGECGGVGHQCAGHNECKGKGWVSLTEKDCKAQGGSVLAMKK